jgi:hypothetical protein
LVGACSEDRDGQQISSCLHFPFGDVQNRRGTIG